MDFASIARSTSPRAQSLVAISPSYGSPGIRERERRRRIVGRVRVVEVHPEKEGARRGSRATRPHRARLRARGAEGSTVTDAVPPRRSGRRTSRTPAPGRCRDSARTRPRTPPCDSRAHGASPQASRIAAGRANPALSLTWCSVGYSPVRIDACDGSVSGTCAVASSNVTPRPPAGQIRVAGIGRRHTPHTRSARSVSIVTRTTSGAC